MANIIIERNGIIKFNGIRRRNPQFINTDRLIDIAKEMIEINQSIIYQSKEVNKAVLHNDITNAQILMNPIRNLYKDLDRLTYELGNIQSEIDDKLIDIKY